MSGSNIFPGTSGNEGGRGQEPRKPRKTLRAPTPIRERCIDASRGRGACKLALPRLVRLHRCGASRRARAPQCTAAVESLCRYCRGLSLLALTRDRRPTLSVDCRRCWLPVHLHPDARCTLISSPRVSPARRPTESVISHWMYDFRHETKRETPSRLAPSHSSVPRFLAKHAFVNPLTVFVSHMKCSFYLNYI